MNKVIAGILGFFLVVSSFFFFVLLNTKILVSNPEKLKTISAKGGLPDILGFYIKDDIVKKSGLSLDEGTNFEDLHQTVSTEAVTGLLNDAIDHLNLALKKPTQANMAFDLTLENTAKPNLSFRKTVDLNNNTAFYILSKAYIALLILLVISCSFGFLSYVFLQRPVERLFFFSSYLVILGFMLTGFWLYLNFGSPNYEFLVQRSDFVRELKLVNGVKRVLEIFISTQYIIYMFESAVFFVFGVALAYLSRYFHDEPTMKMNNKL